MSNDRTKLLTATSPLKNLEPACVAVCSWPCIFDSFSKLSKKPGSSVYSEPFGIGDYKFKIQVHPGGDCEEAERFVSIYLILCQPSFATIKYIFCILDSKGNKRVSSNTLTSRFNLSKNKSAYGMRKYTEFHVLQPILTETSDQLIVLCEIFDLNFCDILYQLPKLHSYEKYLNNKAFSDVEIIVQGKVIHAHKMILISENEVFAGILPHDLKESKKNMVNVDDVEFDVMLELIRFIYVGKVNNIESMAQKLLKAADKYRITELKDICERHLCCNLTVSNVIENIMVSEQFNLGKLFKFAFNFFVKNKKAVAKTSEFQDQLKTMGAGLMARLFTDVCEFE
ncbi:hypothetical protein QAD02_016540 [Eretmocerus hayati]|uniref:Uncharacterized protein n=1 Tax=Eretmocerus hayati TaxID=131215 RepID=A0ACC2PBD4_9HYME|nr:hypothetical protein QAD02_016540 [Eretmocerus hayati]